jgi:hypothetical protein
VVKIADIKYNIYNEAAKFTTKSKRGRGKPAGALVYIPTEAELKEMLKAAGAIAEDVSAKTGDKLQGEFSIWPEIPFEYIKSPVLFKSFVMSYQVFQHGEGQYSRKQLTEPIGANIRSAKAYALMMRIDVVPNPRKLEPLKEEEFGTLPKDDEEWTLWISRKWITENDHIANSTINRKKYPYTQDGAMKALKASKINKVFRAKWTASTYNPNRSTYYGVYVQR